MRLHDIESAYLLPRFAHNAEWEQNALDVVVKSVRAKSFAMGAPYTRKAIAALSDAELQEFYFQYGIAIYYPDLSRETRENMLFELARVYRSLGTPHSVELLCEYIFDGADKVVVEIHDNLAFNAAGELVDDSLLDLFDVDLFPTSPTLSQDKIERIVENIFRFCRNSQTLRDIIIEFPDVAELPIASCDLESYIYTIGGDDIAAQPDAIRNYDFILVDSTTGRVTYGVENLTEIEFTPTGYFTIDEGNEVIFVEQSPFPVVCIDEGTRTPESIVPDGSFDTELPYYASKLYIVTTDDGQDETLYGWEAEEGTPAVAPSVGDIITLGKYPQNTSNTPEDIEWIVLAVDASNHKALLISKYILDACKYAQFGTSSTTWKESRARDWLNSTFYDSAFNIFEKRVVIQSNITTPDNPTYGTSGGDSTQDRLFFLSAQEASSLFADDNARKTTATWKARADGTWSDNNYAVWLTRTPGQTNAFVVNVSHGGSVYEVGDDINSTWTGARPSLWFDYAEPIPEPLPAVTLDAGWCTTPSNHVDFPASTTQQARYWQNAGWQSFQYDSTKAYAAWWWNSDSSGSGYFGIVLSDNGDGYFGITNVLSYTISRFVEARYATCESPDAVAIQVLNSSNVAYAAFKYTQDGIDYYYVLDEVQTDWTDDLSSIGYHI